MTLRDSVAVVTGGARRLGRATALALARAGCHVVVSHRQPAAAAAEQTVNEARAFGVRAEAYAADVSDPTAAHGLIDHVVATFGRLDLLVANAGAFRRTPLEQATAEDWNAMIHGNLDTAFFCAQRAGLYMRERGGAIVAVTDVAAFRPWAGYGAYCAAKSCVVALVEELAVELAPMVRVNGIAPGPVLFPDDFDPAARRREIERTLLRREGTPGDVAAAVLFLAQADYITGTVLPVDGGRLLFARDR